MTVDLVLRVAFAIVAVVAGLVGVVMLAAPGSTGDYFSWAIGPPPLAALVGGFYVASTVVFGLAIKRSWIAVRGLVAAVLGLTLPTLVATLVHSEVFDFSRPVAIVWLLLFVGSPATYGTILVLRRHEHAPPGGVPVARGFRMLFGALAAALVALALLCWLARGTAADLVPFALAPMGAAFLGAWGLFLAVLAAWVALRGRADEAEVPLLGLVAYPAGGILAALTTLGDLQPDGRRLVWLVALAAIATAAATASRAASTSAPASAAA